jgi:hypothetical protein
MFEVIKIKLVHTKQVFFKNKIVVAFEKSFYKNACNLIHFFRLLITISLNMLCICNKPNQDIQDKCHNNQMKQDTKYGDEV